MNRFFHFLQYHNAVPLALGVVFLGATGTYAATNPEAIYATEEHVLSVDNTYVADKDFTSWTPRAEITGVTEDSDNYYVAYKFSTIDNVEYVWRDTVKDETMTVSKADLGQYRDLGVYVTQQLKQKIDRELARLVETQEIEKRNVSQKVVATTYSGLIGKMLDATTEELPGYTPVVVAPPEFAGSPPGGQVAAAAGSTAAAPTSSNSDSRILYVLGNNPAYIPLNASYIDLGAVIIDPDYSRFGIHTFLNDAEVPYISIDTGTTSEWRVRYNVQTESGYVGDVVRRVIVYDPANPPVFEEQVPNAPPSEPAPAEETPTPTPEPTSAPQTETPVEETPPPVSEPEPAPASTTPETTEPEAVPETMPAPVEETPPAAETPVEEPAPETTTPEPAPAPAEETPPGETATTTGA